MKAILYIRVSSAEQVDGTSLSTQEATCRAWCEREGYEVAAVFRDEGESAKTKDRPGLLAALDFARKHDADILLVHKIDRLSRQQRDFHDIRWLLAGFGVQLRSATETITDDPAGKLLEGMLAAFAQFDNDVRAERTRAGMRAAAHAGAWVWQAPLGYRNSRDAEGKASLAHDDERAGLIRHGFEQVASGSSQAEALRRITAHGLRGLNGKPIALNRWNRMLRAAVYSGWIVHRTAGPEPVRGTWTPIVPQLLFDEVQAALARPEPMRQWRSDRPEFPLRRFVRCAGCGQGLTAQWVKQGRYAYYLCHRCRAVCDRKETVERAFVTLLESLSVRPAYVRLFREVVIDVWRTRTEASRDAGRAQARRVAELEHKQERLLDLLLAETVDEETYHRRAAAIRTELTLRRMDARQMEGERLDVEAVLEFAARLLSNPARMWRAASLPQRQRLQGLIFPEGVIWDGESFQTPVTCPVVSHLQAGPAHRTEVAPLLRGDSNGLMGFLREVNGLRLAAA